NPSFPRLQSFRVQGAAFKHISSGSFEGELRCPVVISTSYMKRIPFTVLCTITILKAIDVGSDCQTVSIGRVHGDDSRLGEAENPLSTGSDLSTTIAQDSTTGLLLDKVPKKRSSASVDRVLVNAFNRVSTIADRVHLSKNVVDMAKQIFTDLHGKQMLKPRSKEAIVTASLYWACRQENNPRTFNEICEATQESKKEIRRCCKLILNVLNIGINPITVEDFMPRFCTSLELPPEIQNAATEIARNAINMHLVLGRSPISVAAAAIYMASKVWLHLYSFSCIRWRW
ncbi:unnamed protein product, partial [Allacma fusca]